MKSFKNSILIMQLIAVLFPVVSCKGKAPEEQLFGKSDLYKILDYASLAGSSHNSQPWKAEVQSNDSILVFADSSRLLGVVDPKGAELFISVGAFIENLDIAAHALGYKTEIIQYNTELNSAMPLASIKLKKSGLPQNLTDLKEMELRTTLRIPFQNLPLKWADAEKLVSMAPSEIILLSSDSPEGRFVAAKELEAYRIQAYQKDAQDELASWMRFSDKDVNTKRDGLTPAGMGIKGIAGFMVRNFMKPEDSKRASFVKSGVEKTQRQVENCGGWILISTENDNVGDWIKVGRIYERLNIQCRWLKLGFHPMNQLIEVPEIEKEVNAKLAQGRNIRFVARVGYVDEQPVSVSKRRPVESFTTFRNNK